MNILCSRHADTLVEDLKVLLVDGTQVSGDLKTGTIILHIQEVTASTRCLPKYSIYPRGKEIRNDESNSTRFAVV